MKKEKVYIKKLKGSNTGWAIFFESTNEAVAIGFITYEDAKFHADDCNFIVIPQPKDESKEVKEGGEGFEGGDLHGMDEAIEALGYLLSSYRADFKNITGAELNDTHAVKYAKYVLNKYPSPKRGRFSY